MVKINLGFNKKRYTRDMSFDNNTTFSFGDVQPLYSQFLLPNSDINVSTKSFVRLSPLKWPTFGRLHLELVSRFVPVSEVFAPFESLLSNIPYSHGGVNFVPSSLPFINGNILFFALLPYCTYKYFKSDGTVYVPEVPDSVIQKLLLGFQLPSDTTFKPTLALGVSALNQDVSFDSADFVVPFSYNNESLFFCVRFTAAAQRLFKVFKGLGYDPLSDPSSGGFVKPNILPLLAFYKSYFDTYAPVRDMSFLNTDCYALIDFLSSNHDSNDFSSLDGYSRIYKLFESFVSSELSNCWYCAPDDYISVHSATPLNVHKSSVMDVFDGFHNTVESSASSDTLFTGNVSSPTPDPLSLVAFKCLSAFTRYIAKDSVIGLRLSTWMQQHFGADVSNQLFNDVHFVGRHTIPLQISDVMSTSDTASADGSLGRDLGAYGGKGLGFGDFNLKYHASVHGYLFVFATVVPDSRTNQGFDSSLLANTRYELPTPEFDGLGYEITDKRCLMDNNGIFYVLNQQKSNGFGYVPRYTGFKYRKNIANGEFARRSSRSTFAPYFLDRLFVPNTIFQNASTKKYMLSHLLMPTASTQWRYITRYDYLSDFDRIFINNPDPADVIHSIEDNFMCQCVFNVSLTDALKPLKMSYDTFDENDNDSRSVSAE